MIFKTAIKYLIWDYCLDIISRKLSINFRPRQGKIRLGDLRVGMYLSEIKEIQRGFSSFNGPAIWKGCTILELTYCGDDCYRLRYSWESISKEHKYKAPNPCMCHTGEHNPDLSFTL